MPELPERRLSLTRRTMPNLSSCGAPVSIAVDDIVSSPTICLLEPIRSDSHRRQHNAAIFDKLVAAESGEIGPALLEHERVHHGPIRAPLGRQDRALIG